MPLMTAPLLLPLLLPVLPASSPPQQVPPVRSSLRLDPATQGTAEDPGVASDGERTVVVYGDDFDHGSGIESTIHVVRGDGRGLGWSPPVRVDQDTGAVLSRKFVQNDCVHLSGNRVYVVWEDRRFNVGGYNDDLYFARSDDGGASFGPERLLDKGMPPGSGRVEVYHVAFSPDAAGDHLYVLVSPSASSAAADDLYLLSSHDGGLTWSGPVPVSSRNGSADADAIALAADGTTVHVAWADDRNGGNATWYRRSTDGGATWGPELRLDSGSPGPTGSFKDGVVLAASGATVAVAWLASAGGDTLLARVSTDAGASFGPERRIGSYATGADDVDNPAVDVAADGTVALVWEDDRSGGDAIHAAASPDGGSTWTADPLISGSRAGFPRVLAAGGALFATWTGSGFPDRTEGAFSLDRGTTWSAWFRVGDTTGDADFAELAWNERYGNLIQVWLADDSGANRLYAGGYRPQFLRVLGPITAGGTVRFELRNFRHGGFGAALISGGAATGSFLLPFGDGRETGLLDDAILRTARANIPGVLSTALVAGDGTTPPLTWPAGLPLGTPLFLAGVSWDATGGVVLGDLTDLVTDSVQ
ncbi:MAG: exo-alpha-sialidase [Planctomycetota bacterium]|nr:MAG: exo-alpha-sialidase [Planctomycetota bacterium]